MAPALRRLVRRNLQADVAVDRAPGRHAAAVPAAAPEAVAPVVGGVAAGEAGEDAGFAGPRFRAGGNPDGNGFEVGFVEHPIPQRGNRGAQRNGKGLLAGGGEGEAADACGLRED